MSFQVVPETQRCSDCGNLVPSANFALHAGRCRGPSPAAAAEDESSHASKKAKAEFAVPADAQQVDLTNSDDDDEGAGNAALNAAQIAADAKLAAELASEGHYAADAQLAAQLASEGGYVGAPFGGGVLRTFKHHKHMVGCLALLPDGLRFVSGSRDNTARIAYHGLAP